ncbi:MAG TPA: hypothetical protein VNA57_02180 [Acidimicrobiales bacterium]|nr:hypothetical protein [Acidimicrobiales bacterium]
MTRFSRPAAITALLLTVFIISARPALADDAPGGEDNAAVAVNTEDGASVFRLAFSVRMVANGVIDEDNRAYALASCANCQTVALAFQVVLVWGDVDVVIPENQAVAYNDQCVECLTYASASQIVLGFDGPVRFTADGRRRLAEWYRSLSELEERVGELSVIELNAAVVSAKAALVTILSEELVTAPAGQGGLATTSTTTSTIPVGATTTSDAPSSSTTSSPSTSSSTTSATSTSSTGSPSSSSTTTTTSTTEVPTTTTAAG